jgi:hypothetical protein
MFMEYCSLMTYDRTGKPAAWVPDIGRKEQVRADLSGVVADVASSESAYDAFILCHYKEERLKSLGVLQ